VVVGGRKGRCRKKRRVNWNEKKRIGAKQRKNLFSGTPYGALD